MILLCDEENGASELVGETFGHAIIDSGCSRTVCGRPWLNTYLDTLSRSDHLLVEKHPDDSKFRFGDGDIMHSKELIVIPVQFGSQQVKLMTCVVDCDVPLLLSRESLKRAEAHIDFKLDKVVLFGEQTDVVISSTGHLCLPLLCKAPKQRVKQVLFSSPLQEDDPKANEKKIIKLHKQFAHPSSDRLKHLIHDSGVSNSDIDGIVDQVSADCDVCKRYRKPPPRPVVSFPLANEFNQVVAMDIKFIGGIPVLHMIDHATRYSMACRVKNKKPETIVDSVLNHWIRIFGSPQYFLTDNGGEFVNSILLELCEKFNIELKTTAAESAWSNGLCERHNAVIGDNVAKVMADCKCTIEVAIAWAICAKNCLSSVYGFSPNQLVFGRNCNLPSVSTDRLPAQNTTGVSANIAKHLLALHKARQAFIAQESCEKLRRALNKQTRSFSDVIYQNGDLVYYKRNNSIEWHGPGKVLGHDGSQYLLKHGGSYVRVHPCKMQLVDSQKQVVPQSHASTQSSDPHAQVKNHISQAITNDASTQYSLDDNVESDSDSDDDYSKPVGSVPLTPPQTPAHPPPNNIDAHVIPIQLNIDHELSEDEALESPERSSCSLQEYDSVSDVVNLSNDGALNDSVKMNGSVKKGGSKKSQVSKTSQVSRAVARLADYNKPPGQTETIRPVQTEIFSPVQTETISPVSLQPSTSETTSPVPVVVKCPKDLPKPTTKISFRPEGADQWTTGDVISGAGKRTTPNWHYMNIKPDTEESAKCFSLKHAEWKVHPPDDVSDKSDEEVYFGTSTDSSRFHTAKLEEISKWREFKTFTEAPDTGQPRVSTRWVCTDKMKGGKLVSKARLVARGFEEDKSQLRTDSPTCTKESLRLLLTISASNKWGLHSIDVKSAFLQGNEISRELYLQPPKEATTNKLWKLQRTPYGLVDAGRKWYLRVQTELTSLGAKQATCDKGLFIWEDRSGGGLCGVLAAHVDDFVFCGDEYFHMTILPKIRSTFHIGTEEEQRFKYLGLSISEVPRGIELNLEDYCLGIKEMETASLGLDRQRLLNSHEISTLKQLVGQINWVSTQCRPDVSYDNCILGTRASKATVADVHYANKVVRKIRGQSLSLTFPSQMDLSTVRLVSFCDASFANLHDLSSQGGFLIFMVDRQGFYSLVCWQSKKVKRKVNSSLGAECLEACEAASTCILIRERLEQMLCCSPGTVKISILTDNKSLVGAVHKSTSLENKRLQIDINILREMVENGELHEFRWVSTQHQIANSLTKQGASSDQLRQILMNEWKYDHGSGLFL